MVAEMAGLALVAVGTALIVTSPPVPPVDAPVRAVAAGDNTPLPFAFAAFPPEPTRLKAGRRVLLTGLGVTALGLVARWVW
ncbi:MAG: hypothetical protein U0871_08840 [Gemmataceae bacterium]